MDSLPPLNSNDLAAFYAVCVERSFSKAALKLHVTQSALSQRVAKLEEDLGVTLLLREKAGPKLTELGHQLLRHCQSRELLEKEFLQNIRSQNPQSLKGEIRIASFSSVLRSAIMPALAPLMRQHPELHISLVSRELRDLPELLKSGEAQYIILDREWHTQGIESVLLGTETHYLVESKKHPSREIYLDHDESDETSVSYMKKWKGLSSLQRRFFDDAYGILDAAKLGLGRAVLSEHLIREEKDLKILNKELKIQNSLVMHFYKQAFYTKIHNEILHCLEKHVPQFL